jgi:hypothetical protein
MTARTVTEIASWRLWLAWGFGRLAGSTVSLGVVSVATYIWRAAGWAGIPTKSTTTAADVWVWFWDGGLGHDSVSDRAIA